MIKKFIVVIITFAAFFSLTTLAISQIDKKAKDDLYSQIELYSYTLTTIQADYVDDIPPKDLIYGSLKGMLASLDPHSQFLEPDEYKELKTDTQGKFGGLGIEISIKDDLLTVVTPIEDTPAWKAGIKSGDRIVKIENELTKNITLNDAVKKLRGKPGTKVNITVLREDEFKILDFTIEREIITIKDVKNTQLIKDKIGYIRLSEFREDSAKAFREALDSLKQKGADGLILDLRNNPGGLLNVAIQITEEFLPQGELIVSTKGRRASQNTETLSTNTSHIVDWPMVILINEGSASGSEILAGALKDHKRAVILGTQSFGKGSVQSVIPLPDGSGLRLTTSKYFTPSGESIHGKGITPDVVVKFQRPSKEPEDEQAKKIEEIFYNVEQKTPAEKEEEKAESPQPPEKKADKKEAEVTELLLKDNQVQSAISVLEGIKVYKGRFDKAPVEIKAEAAK
ncbi:MAG: S41 family peptidase [Candidatus Omnitrophica bacterium]|nr:S41 family peptidase [Candidatus Omnitrophota bacterium]